MPARQHGFSVIATLLVVFIIGTLVFLYFYLGLVEIHPDQIKLPYLTEQNGNKVDESNPENTIQFSKLGRETYLKYKEIIYTYDDPQTLNPRVASLNDVDLQWQSILTTQSEIKMFGFRNFPGESFMFITYSGGNDESAYKVYYYDGTSIRKVRLAELVSISLSGTFYKVPKIDQISADGKYVSFKMFKCWDCALHHPEIMIFNTQENKARSLGKISYFRWLENGKYEYKDFQDRGCQIGEQGECFRNPGSQVSLFGEI